MCNLAAARLPIKGWSWLDRAIRRRHLTADRRPLNPLISHSSTLLYTSPRCLSSFHPLLTPCSLFWLHITATTYPESPFHCACIQHNGNPRRSVSHEKPLKRHGTSHYRSTSLHPKGGQADFTKALSHTFEIHPATPTHVQSTQAKRRLIRDFKRLASDPPIGISGSPNPDNIMIWNAVIFGPREFPLCDAVGRVSNGRASRAPTSWLRTTVLLIVDCAPTLHLVQSPCQSPEIMISISRPTVTSSSGSLPIESR